MIKVIRGLYKGKRLKRLADPRVRPMPDKLKEALFHILDSEVRGAVVLDGFAGTGSLGIEALSRGAARVVFIEELGPAARTIIHNLERCQARDRAAVLQREFNRGVIQLGKERALFDLILLDPPYKLLEERNPLKVIKKREILKPGGRILLRRHRKTKFDPKFFAVQRDLTLGDDTVLFLAHPKLNGDIPTKQGTN